MPVLLGPQGIGKSSALGSLLPPEHSEWYSDGLDLAADSKTLAESLQGRVIVEVSEMAGSSRADLERLKAFLTRTDDGNVRLAHRRNPEPAPRRAMLVGTANDTGVGVLPNDPTGLRRFAPVELGAEGADVETWMAEHRTQLWAEALHLHIVEVSPRLPRALIPQAGEVAEEHRRKNAILEDAIDVLAQTTQEGLTLASIAEKLALAGELNPAERMSARDEKRLGAALTARGWEKRRERQPDGAQRRLWFPPES